MRPLIIRTLSTSLLATLLPLTALAATPIHEVRPLASDGMVKIDNLKGEIIVRTWDKAEVLISGSLGDGVEKLQIDGSASLLGIVVRNPKSSGWFGAGNHSEPTTLEVTVPATASLDIEGVSSDIDVRGSRGRKLAAESVSGDIRIADSSAGDSHFETVSGDQDLQLSSQSVEASSVSGDIRLQGNITGEVHIETVSGDSTLTLGAIDRLSFDSVSGDSRINTDLGRQARIKGESVSGNIALSIPRSSAASIHVETFSGAIRSPVGKVITERYGPGKKLDATLGDGSASLSLEAFSGNVELTLR